MTDTAATRDAGLAVLGTVDFDWAMHLNSVWSDSPYDVPDLNHKVRKAIEHRLQLLTMQSNMLSPLGWGVTGSGGTGKTHLLSWLRRETHLRHMPFVLVDMTDVHDFWDTVLLGYVNSLQQPDASGQSQLEVVLQRVLTRLALQQPAVPSTTDLRTADPVQLVRQTRTVLSALHRLQPIETMSYQNVVRGLVALGSDDFTMATIGLSWLQAHPVEREDQRTLGLTGAHNEAIDIVRGLSWIMSLAGPTVLAVDQLDPIVSQLNIACSAMERDQSDEDIVVAKVIIEGISRGLGALRDVTRRTLPVISCLETTWDALAAKFVLRSNMDRFEPPRKLAAIKGGEVAAAIVRERLAPAFREAQFQPPYDTWPFRAEAFEAVHGLSPRQLLKLCDAHRNRCLQEDRVTELTRFAVNAPTPAISTDRRPLAELDAQFARYRTAADPRELLDEHAGDEQFAPLLQVACRCLIHENPPPADVEASVDCDFGKDQAKASLHARLRIKYPNEGDREEHFCIRALQRTNACAFQARLKAAMTHAGIDRRLDFRRLTIVRTTELPGGPVTAKMVTQFGNAGGRLDHPNEKELRTLWALWKMHQDKLDDFPTWLRERRPASGLTMMEQAVALLGGHRNAAAQHDAAEQDEAAVAVALSCADTAVMERPWDTPSRPMAAGAPVSANGGREARGSVNPANGRREAPVNVNPPNVCPQAAGNGASDGPIDNNQADRVPTRDAQTRPTAAEAHKGAAAGHGGHDIASERSSPVRTFVLGHHLIGGSPQQPAAMSVGKLSEHTLILAGSGSGKTVLVRRLIEEVALLGIPSIVIDCANDLAALGDRWPTPPSGWDNGDQVRAERYHNDVQTVVWTPGKQKGNPLTFDPLPDLAAVADDSDELDEAVLMVSDSLRDVLAPGNGAAAKLKRGILVKALKYFATHSGKSLTDLAALLADLPPEAGLGIPKEAKLAEDMSGALLAEMAVNPLLGGAGAGIDPAVLFGDVAEASKTRISVINFSFLASQAKQQLLNQLAMTLFTWIKKHPEPPDGRALRGLLVIDEARDYVPSGKSTVCKNSLIQLVAQARKYRLGIVFATQGPTDIDHKIVGNCAMKYLGKVAAPAAIKVVTELIKQSGGHAANLAALGKGRFYRCGANGSQPPTKVQTPMCLSHHPKNPLTPDQVLERAIASRLPIAAPDIGRLPPIDAELEAVLMS